MYVSDSIDMAIVVGLFDPAIVEKCEIILQSRATYLTKLSALDYVITNAEKIDELRYCKISQLGLTSRNDIVIFQSYINYILCDLKTSLAFLLEKSNYPLPFYLYRLINNIMNIDFVKQVIRPYKGMVKLIIEDSEICTRTQKEELIRYLSESL
jgi:hypothetical protein